MPPCCPSRSTFLSGQFAHNNGVRHNSPPQGGYAKLNHKNTLPVWMQKAGYVTSHIGKSPNGYGKKNPKEVPPGWDEWRGSVDPTTYRMWGYRLNENGKLKTYGNPLFSAFRGHVASVPHDRQGVPHRGIVWVRSRPRGGMRY